MFLAALFVGAPIAAQNQALKDFQQKIEPILQNYCYDCHGDGSSKGKVTLDEFKTDEALRGNPDLWFRVLKNVRAGVMPPAGKDQPTADEKKLIEQWIKYQALSINPADPDPGRVTLRRLNRVEYANTIRDLMGVDYKTEEEFPPDDTGYGFDTVGDALNVSPLLLEKYMQAAETIVNRAVPKMSRMVPETLIAGSTFRSSDQKDNNNQGDRRRERPSRNLSFYQPATLTHTFKAPQAGKYRIVLEFIVDGAFNHDPGRAKVLFKIGDKEVLAEGFNWEGDDKRFTFEFDEQWEPGDKVLTFELRPLTPPAERKASIDLRINSVLVQGPMEREKWSRPKNFDRFFTKDAPENTEERKAYAREVLGRFASKAFRRPVDEKTLARLVAIAEAGYTVPDATFEQGVAQAMVAVLASPRFLFRVEDTAQAPAAAGHPLIDEHSLASRLSYFIWSSMPDDELTNLAARGELRKNLPAQVKRMLAQKRPDALVPNFIGQWLQVRDIDGISIDARLVLARDAGSDKDIQQMFEQLRVMRAKREEETRRQIAAGVKVAENQRTPEEEKLRARLRELRNGPQLELDEGLRRAMRMETEMFFEHVMREDRSVLDLLDSDYTFLNERLARHYGIRDVKGEEMRRVELPKDSPRGGLLTHGSILVVTSNPTRTSPVKRGLFVLENILGSPTPPPPPDVPELEASEKAFEGKEPSLREVLELHRSKPLCSSCHNRMDPLGLALDNFNALGMWRDSERKQPIDSAGKLITGESFNGIRDLKKILRNDRKIDFYRCITEKLMTYALGRGMEHYDVETIDQIVARLEKEDGKFSALMTGIVESAAFQKRRRPGNDPNPPAEARAQGPADSSISVALPDGAVDNSQPRKTPGETR